MKLIIMSDVHVANNHSDPRIDKVRRKIFIDYCSELEGDYLVINGDLSNFSELNNDIKRELEDRSGLKVILVPGNFEIEAGFEDSGLPISDIYKRYVESRSYKENAIDKIKKISDEWSLLPALGGFDGTFETEWSDEEILRRIRNDSDPKVNRLIRFLPDERKKGFLLSQIQKWQEEVDKSDVKNVIFIQHFVPLSRFTVKESDIRFQSKVKMLGSELIGDFILSNEKIKIVHFGHTHILRDDVRIKGKRFILRPTGNIEESPGQSYRELLKDNTVILSF